ncbi:MAG: hypothetical protein INR71_10310 [Terriglobus roseus]|nr:hypothetical protein [Terriglobus roseus]
MKTWADVDSIARWASRWLEQTTIRNRPPLLPASVAAIAPLPGPGLIPRPPNPERLHTHTAIHAANGHHHTHTQHADLGGYGDCRRNA